MKRKPVHLQPAGVHVDALHEIRKAMRALRRAEDKIMARIRADKRAAERRELLAAALAPKGGA